ncbi:MAG: diaminopimelate decarboxylase [Bacteroidales bacterium]|nr:diaminopimelate decarboxylase [Bacteroidales bacterium]
MNFTGKEIEKFGSFSTPFYYYNLDLLKKTLEVLKAASLKYGYKIHYAVKANANERILRLISSYGFGADCVSGNEVSRAVECGFDASKVVFAGVGKSDKEILTALRLGIFCFNSESVQEVEVINSLAKAENKTASVALRLNPGIDAHTNQKINTGLADSKFGIPFTKLKETVEFVKGLSNIKLIGIHYHIGSQILDFEPYKLLCERSNEIQVELEKLGLQLPVINLGGGLGIDYNKPEKNSVPEFEKLLDLIHKDLKVKEGQEVHFEFGRSVVAQCGVLVSKVLYVKQGDTSDFAILDAGFTDLIRPALYGAYHKIENLTSKAEQNGVYDVVGPICESTDVFAKSRSLKKTSRGDLLAFYSAGAYGEIMASRYNLRDLPNVYYSEK